VRKSQGAGEVRYISQPHPCLQLGVHSLHAASPNLALGACHSTLLPSRPRGERSHGIPALFPLDYLHPDVCRTPSLHQPSGVTKRTEGDGSSSTPHPPGPLTWWREDGGCRPALLAYTPASAHRGTHRSIRHSLAYSRVSGCSTGHPPSGYDKLSAGPGGTGQRRARAPRAGSRLPARLAASSAQDSSEMPAVAFLVTISSHAGLHSAPHPLSLPLSLMSHLRSWGASPAWGR
jgi:hypothetical protein